MNDQYRMLTKIVRNMNLKKNSLGRELNYNEEEALRFISKHDGCIANEVADYLNVDKALVTRIIKKLEEKNYIVCLVLEDKRKKHLKITEKGLNYKWNNQTFERDYYKSLFETIDPKEQEVFFMTLEKLYLVSKQKRKQENEKIR